MIKVYKLIFSALTFIYLILAFTLPTNPSTLERYQLTQDRAHLLVLTIAIPSVLIWLASLYGVLKFHEYSNAIKDSTEGPSFNLLSSGLMVLVISLPFMALVSTLTTYAGYRNPELLPSLTITRNYLTLLFPMITFLLISRGTETLLTTLKKRKVANIPRFGLMGIILLSSFYTWLIATHPVNPDGDRSYYLPGVLVILTLLVPYLFMWSKGLLAAYQLYIYKNHVKGTIYREALSSLSMGLGTIIVLSVFLQFLATLSTQLARLNLSSLLSVIYLLVALTAIGYGLVARGSKKLKQIEEV